MKTYTVEQFQERWDEMISRVENGENIGITNGENTAIMIMEDEFIRLHTEYNNEAS